MRKWIQHSFRNRMFISILLVTLLPLLLCDVVMMQLLVVRNAHSMAQDAQTDLDHMEVILDDLWSEFDSMTEGLSRSTIVRSALRSGRQDSKVLYQLLFRNTRVLREYITVEVYDSSGICRYATAQESLSKQLPLRWDLLYDAGKTDQLVCRTLPESGISAARRVPDASGGSLGYIVIRMQQTGFDKALNGAYHAGSNAMLLDNQWRLAYYSRSGQGVQTAQALRSQLLDGAELTGIGVECEYHLRKLSETGFTLIVQQPKVFSTPVMKTIYLTGGAMGVLCLILCLFCSWMLSRHLVKPIDQLDDAMREIEAGNYQVQLESERDDELGRLTVSFNRMTTEYRQNLRRSVERQNEVNQAQMRMMQAQLNPHFLYNTLDSVKWLGITNHVPQIADLATNLAGLLRAAIDGSELVTVSQELELMERYLEIQYIRFEDRFTCEIEVDEQFQNCIIPKLMLQPLVENAIIHGVSDCEEGYIKIWAEPRGENFLLWVSDNGQGIPETIMQQLNSPDRRIQGNHLGLYNVDRLLRIRYGEDYGLRVKPGQAEGCCVGLKLPMIRKEQAEC